MGSLGQRLSSITTHPGHNFPGRWSLVNNSWAALADWGPRALLLLLGRKENGVTLQRCDIYINKNPTALWKYFVELFHKSTMELTWSSAPKFRELMCGLLQGRNKANLAQTTARLSWPFRLLTFLSCPLLFMSSYGCSMHSLALLPSMAGSDWHVGVWRRISFPCGLVLERWWQRDIIPWMHFIDNLLCISK